MHQSHQTITGIIVAMMITIMVLVFCLWKSDCHAEAIIITPSSPVITIQPPVGLPSYAYTNSSGVTTVVPPVGLPSTIYPSSVPGGASIVQPSTGLPTMIYGR